MNTSKVILTIAITGVLTFILGFLLALAAFKQPSNSKAPVDGVGGIFFKVDNPKKFKAWYKKHLGIDSGPSGAMIFWRTMEDPEVFGRTVWAPFSKDSDYFGSKEQKIMINYRVNDLDALLKQLHSSGVKQVGDVEEYWYGRFAWIIDVEGNKVELWEPVDLTPDKFYEMLKENDK